MQTERRPQQNPQEIQVVPLVPEQAVIGMQQALLNMLRSLPTPITITKLQDPRNGKDYFTYQVGEKTEAKPFGLARGATPYFCDAVRFSLEAAMKPKFSSKQ